MGDRLLWFDSPNGTDDTAMLYGAANWLTDHGGGTIVLSDGQSCTGDCGAIRYPINTTLTLTAQPNPGFTFVGWQDDCATAVGPGARLDITNNHLIDHTTALGSATGGVYDGLSGLIQTDGWREHSAARRGQLNARWQTDYARGSNLSVIANALEQRLPIGFGERCRLRLSDGRSRHGFASDLAKFFPALT